MIEEDVRRRKEPFRELIDVLRTIVDGDRMIKLRGSVDANEIGIGGGEVMFGAWSMNGIGWLDFCR